MLVALSDFRWTGNDWRNITRRGRYPRRHYRIQPQVGRVGRFNLTPTYLLHLFDSVSTTLGVQAAAGQGGTDLRDVS